MTLRWSGPTVETVPIIPWPLPTHSTTLSNLQWNYLILRARSSILWPRWSMARYSFHTKTTDSHLYLMFSSCHPPQEVRQRNQPHLFYAHTLPRTEPTPEDPFEQQKISNLQLIWWPDRQFLLQHREKQKNDRVPLVTTYHPVLKNLTDILKNICLF